MKKVFSLIATSLLIVACTPKGEVKAPFKAGQKVTLVASMGGNGAKNMPGQQRVTGLDNGAQIDLTWTEGDQITVKVGDATAVFTLESGAGSANGTFTGEMPAAGTTYSVEYPANYDESVLTNQTYTANGFGKGLMKMSTKTEGTLDGGFVLTPDNALLGLQLTGAEALGDIVLTNTATSQTYTLNCAGVTLSNTATLFYLVVPAGEWANGFVVDVKDSEGNVITSFTKASAATFSATEAMVMPVKEVATSFVPEAVDLGLSVKWASCNVGATTPEGYGYYFAWGETSPKDDYSYATYKWMQDGNRSQLTKYCTLQSHGYNGFVDGKKVLELEDDAARANWGGNWQMPTLDNMKELMDENKCIWEWQSEGVKGYKVTGPNGNSIFLPAAGLKLNTSVTQVGQQVAYCSTLIYDNYPSLVNGFSCIESKVQILSTLGRVTGFPVRAVCP